MRLTKKKENYNLKVNDKYNPIVTTREITNKLGEIEDLLDLYGIETLVDLNVILAEYFCEMKDHTFKAKDKGE